VAAAVLALVALLDLLVDGPVRRSVEREANRALKGYELTIGAADLSPWRLSLELFDVELSQQAHPEPAVLALPELEFNVAWRALLRGALVADVILDRPALHVDLTQLREELEDDVEMDDRGWQSAIEEMYPLEIQHLRVRDAQVTYVDSDPDRPLELRNLRGEAGNIRNISSPEQRFPSTFWLESGVFDDGRLAVHGRADFLAAPTPRLTANYEVQSVALDRLRPVTEDYRLELSGGRLSSRGAIELSDERRSVDVGNLVIERLRLDYLSDPELTEQAAEALGRTEAEAGLAVQIDHLQLADSEVGFVDRSRKPDYRLYMADLDADVRQWSNRTDAGPSSFEATGQFMGSGRTRVSGHFRPDLEGADFDLSIAIQGTHLESMNDLWRAWANLDVTQGMFSFYSELAVSEGELRGYVKPLFQDVDVYDPEQDKGENVFHRLWEGLVEEVTELLENEKRDEVVTVADLHGAVGDPEASNAQVIVNLVRNGFIEAILPGFRSQAERR
jgi:hypothetical protein